LQIPQSETVHSGEEKNNRMQADELLEISIPRAIRNDLTAERRSPQPL
jgi:hypothetical protein